jgi:hypothetical protein
MALRLACQQFMKRQQSRVVTSAVVVPVVTQQQQHRCFAAESTSPALKPGDEAPSVFDKIISLTIVDPSGARRKINGMVGELTIWSKREIY